MALCTITGFVYMPNGQPASGRVFKFKTSRKGIVAGYFGAVVPDVIEATTDDLGFLTVQLLTGDYVAFSALYNGPVSVPDADTASLYEVLGGAGSVTPPDIAPNFISLPSLLGSTALGGVITVDLGSATGSPEPVITGMLTRPGASPVAVTQGQLITVSASDQGGSLSLTATATNAAGVDTETVSRAIPAAIPAPAFTTPLADVVLTVGDADVVVNLDDNTDNATSYSVSPAGGAVTISGSSMAVSAAAPVDQLYVVTATGPGGTTTDTFGVLIEAASAPLSRLAVHIDSDIDTVGERDDISAMALWLANQDDFNILGMTTSPPDSNSQEYLNCIAAYEQDRPTLLTKGADPILFKTGDALRSLVVAGTTEDAPARGYRLPGESQYAGAHAAAQLLIQNARDHGNPTSTDLTRKLWVIVQGGYNTLAQAAYEAVVLGELPDFFDRVRILGQPNWNSRQTINAWSYLFNNCWPAAGTPGIFGNMWMLNGYLQWQGLNRDNGGSDTTFWNQVTANSFFGQHLRSTLTRPQGSFTSPHFRAGDAGAWFWLLYAKEQQNFNPSNPNNPCGVYRTYVGELWAAQTFGYGPGSGQNVANPDPQGMTYSPTMFAPNLTVDSPADAQAALNLTEWYNRVRTCMALYQAQSVPSQITNITISGTTVSWVAPFNGFSPITDYILTLDGTVVTDGVGTATTYDFGPLADGTYAVTIAAVNALGTGMASTARTLTVDSEAPTGSAFRVDEGAGSAITSVDGRTATLVNGPSWATAPVRLNFDGSNDRIDVAVLDTDSAPTDFVFGVVARLSTVSGARVLASRNGANSTTQRHFQFRNNGGVLEFVSHPADNSTATVFGSAAGAVVANEWAMFFFQGLGGVGNLRKNGVQVGTGSISAINRSAAMLGVPILVGGRFNPAGASYADFLTGSIAAIYPMKATNDIAAAEAELRAIAADKGITLP